MQQKHVVRTPMPRKEEIKALPSVAQDMLGFFENKIDIVDYKNLARGMVDAANGKVPNFGKGTIRYENPNLRKQAQLYSQIGEYNPDKIPIATYEKMRLDPTIALATSFIELQILAQNFRIECANPRIAAVVHAIIRPIYRKTVKSMLRAVQFGFAVGEKIYKKVKLKVIIEDDSGNSRIIHNKYTVVVDKVKFAHPGSIKIERDKKTEEIKYVIQKQDYFSNIINIEPKVKIGKCIWFSHDEEYGNFFGSARYKAAYQPWYFGQIVLQFMLRYLERQGAPAAKGRAPLGNSTTSDGEKVGNIDVILEAANALVSNSAVAIPSQYDKNGNQLWDVELVEDEQRGEMFLEVIRALNLLKTRALFVPDKVGVAEGSSTNATAESHLDVHLLAEEALIQMIEDCLNTQLIPDIMQFNFPPSKQIPCYIKIERLNYSKRTLLRDVLLRMLMFYSSSMRDGNWPNWLPSVKEISKFLEVPGSESPKLFLPPSVTDDKTDESSDDDDFNPDDDNDEDELDKEQKIKDRNKDANKRKERTRRDRRSRERV